MEKADQKSNLINFFRSMKISTIRRVLLTLSNSSADIVEYLEQKEIEHDVIKSSCLL